MIARRPRPGKYGGREDGFVAHSASAAEVVLNSQTEPMRSPSPAEFSSLDFSWATETYDVYGPLRLGRQETVTLQTAMDLLGSVVVSFLKHGSFMYCTLQH